MEDVIAYTIAYGGLAYMLVSCIVIVIVGWKKPPSD